MATKRFSVSSTIMEGLEDTIRAAEDYSGELRHEVLKLEKVELDEDNPRDLKITMADILHGIKKDDPFHDRKRKEKDDLLSLSNSIKSDGLINPILVYQNGNKYKVLAGERRTLASLMAGKDMIHARIIDRKPDEAKVAILQWAENVERKDLSLLERRDNLLKLKAALSKVKGIEFNAKAIMEILGCSKTHAYRYLALMEADEELVEHIKQGTIQNLKDIESLTAAESQDKRQAILEALRQGLRALTPLKKAPKAQVEEQTRKPGRQSTRVNFGSTKNVNIAKEIVSILLSDPRLKDLKKEIGAGELNYDALNVVFAKILERLEKQV